METISADTRDKLFSGVDDLYFLCAGIISKVLSIMSRNKKKKIENHTAHVEHLLAYSCPKVLC